MEVLIEEPIEDCQNPRSSTDVVSEVLSKTSATSKFLKNVGVESSSKPTSNEQWLKEQLEVEREGTDVLQWTVDSQQQELDSVKKQVQVSEALLSKQQQDMEVMRKKQEETDHILARLLGGLSRVNPSV